MWGAVPTTLGSGMRSDYENIYPSLEASPPGFLAPVRHVSHLPYGPLLIGMTTCHSLTRIDGNLIGDPLDLKVSTILRRADFPFCICPFFRELAAILLLFCMR